MHPDCQLTVYINMELKLFYILYFQYIFVVNVCSGFRIRYT